MPDDILITNGSILDGSGRPAFDADILIRKDRILDIGRFPEAKADQVLDAQGLTVAPGFIDAHAHLDFFFPCPRHPEVLKSWAYQGVTTIVAGNCGYSPAPIHGQAAEAISTYWNFALPRDGLKFEWAGMGEFLDFLDERGLAFNAAILTGHNTLRTHVMGFEARFAREAEIAAMKTLLKASLQEGSIGLSVGLFYSPGIFSHTDELQELASVMTEFGSPLVAHTRGLTNIYDQAVEEVIGVAERNRIPLQLSHHAGGLGEVRARAVQAVREAVDRGVKIGHDNIPWAFGPTTILALLPPWLFDGGVEAALERMKNPSIRKRMVHEIENHVPAWPTWDNDWWTDKFFSFANLMHGFRLEHNLRFEGKTMKDIAGELPGDAYDAIFDLIVEEGGRLFIMGGLLDDPRGDDWMAHLISDPDCSIMTDIVGVDFETGNPAPYGAFTKVLGDFVRDRGLFSLAEAVRRMTSLPAAQMGLTDRGVLKKGAYADITVFNPGTVKNLASFHQPRRLSVGIEYVLINGRIVLNRGVYDAAALAGRTIRRSSCAH